MGNQSFLLRGLKTVERVWSLMMSPKIKTRNQLDLRWTPLRCGILDLE
jgi:hypothetical protein